MKQSLLRTEKKCYVTGAKYLLDCHHIYAGPNRKHSDKYGCWVWLRHDIHMSLHDRDKELDYRLKRECQEAFEKIYDRDTFRRIFGKSYL